LKERAFRRAAATKDGLVSQITRNALIFMGIAITEYQPTNKKHTF
jgi:hypothetical protein